MSNFNQYNATRTLRADGTVVTQQETNAVGDQSTTLNTALTDTNHSIASFPDHYNALYISTNTTTAVKASPGYVKGILVGETAAGAITVNDGSTTVAVLKASIVEGYYPIEAYFATDIEVVTAAASKLTVIYR